jgi:hypothetical protein
MKKYTELLEEITGETEVNVDELPVIQEGLLRTLGTAGLMIKVRNINKQITNIKTKQNEDTDVKIDKLFKKIDLLGTQNMVTGLLITTLGIMDKKGKKRK